MSSESSISDFEVLSFSSWDEMLHCANPQDHHDDVRSWLWKYPDNVDIEVPEGRRTPLWLAITQQRLERMRELLEAGADVERGVSNWSPLLVACCIGFLEGVKLLVERGANLAVHTENGLTCLTLATINKHRSIVSYLLEQESCPVVDVDRDGYNALHCVVLLNDPCMVCKVIQEGAPINAQSLEGETPLFLAAKHCCLDSLRILLAFQADPNVFTKNGGFALHEAIRKNSSEAVDLLLKHGADRQRFTRSGITLLEVAMSLAPRGEDILDNLLKESADREELEDLRWKLSVMELDLKKSQEEAQEGNIGREKAEEKVEKFQSDLEEFISCPITLSIMQDPVVASDGFTYERDAIVQWLRRQHTSPVTRQPLHQRTLVPNIAMRQLITKYNDVFEPV